MKLLLNQQPNQRPSQHFEAGNEVLRLAVEMLEGNGQWPTIDVRGARVSHWNGRKISIARCDITDLIDRGLLDGNGRWTDYGRAFVLFGLERYEEAFEWVQRARLNPNPRSMTFAFFAAVLSKLGRRDEARAAVNDLLAHAPGMSCAKCRENLFGAPATMERLADALGDAGLPD